ncbi:dinitrogenase iron-molybdenum cofactor biosynthesis protein [Azoarcus indigens]|uniref:Putative Fe-Mo cluster-binding NifX family protein n=1 Tax=Azoarcus indigens TaxID=29545 RepID=A0A4R6DP80_9RHOO|nr:NifB/NifX family molybdenum-iron cluster-binding protein [Azoarcus indigens]NMG67798.1 dinitrogenase iron-molybdenum cofactor biosynthesis protein [Azoarcus indigens]TDN46791.1 putative Fe-Mo cluster-binding NifX family protein [Azoarcus indigens]
MSETAKPLRVAVASKEGVAVSEHFGHAKTFHIYDVEAGGHRLVETREVAHYCLGGSSDQGALAGILEAVADCKAVLVAKIGDGPTAKLAARGVEGVADYAWEEIGAALSAYAASRGI